MKLMKVFIFFCFLFDQLPAMHIEILQSKESLHDVQFARDLAAILELQKANVRSTLHPDVAAKQGFLTRSSDLDRLTIIANYGGIIVARQEPGGPIIGFLLTLTPYVALLLDNEHAQEALDGFDGLRLAADKKLKDFKYCQLAQVCVAKEHRGKGVFKSLCRVFKESGVGKDHEFAVSLIHAENKAACTAYAALGAKKNRAYGVSNVTMHPMLFSTDKDTIEQFTAALLDLRTDEKEAAVADEPTSVTATVAQPMSLVAQTVIEANLKAGEALQ